MARKPENFFQETKHSLRCLPAAGTSAICETWATQVAVIPAKAGIHSAGFRKCALDGLDSRFRGNDWRFERGSRPK
jgi:hypothetical protein